MLLRDVAFGQLVRGALGEEEDEDEDLEVRLEPRTGRATIVVVGEEEGDDQEAPLLDALVGPIAEEGGDTSSASPRLPAWLERLVCSCASKAEEAAAESNALPPPFARLSSQPPPSTAAEPALARACALEASAFQLPMVCAGEDGAACAGLPDYVDAKVVHARGEN